MTIPVHTPGPWSLAPEFHGDHGQYYVTDDLDGSEIASVTAWIGEHRAEAEANARLIAAAPELLDALKEALDINQLYADFIRNVKADDIESHPYLPRVEEANEQSHRAISKATGTP